MVNLPYNGVEYLVQRQITFPTNSPLFAVARKLQ